METSARQLQMHAQTHTHAHTHTQRTVLMRVYSPSVSLFLTPSGNIKFNKRFAISDPEEEMHSPPRNTTNYPKLRGCLCCCEFCMCVQEESFKKVSNRVCVVGGGVLVVCLCACVWWWLGGGGGVR